jgi:hypothetical protein
MKVTDNVAVSPGKEKRRPKAALFSVMATLI